MPLYSTAPIGDASEATLLTVKTAVDLVKTAVDAVTSALGSIASEATLLLLAAALAKLGTSHPQNVVGGTAGAAASTVAALKAGKTYQIYVESQADGTKTAIRFSLTGAADASAPKLESSSTPYSIAPETDCNLSILRGDSVDVAVKVAGLTATATTA
jgi:hypothetical protein